MVANTFSSAWQLSALADQSREEKERFFSNVYAVYFAVALVVASGVILTAQISTRLLAAPDYYEAWRYVPVLTLATTFGCLSSFLASIYMVEQRSGATLFTTMLGAVANVVGPMGAAISTLLSYILIFSVRAIHTRTMLRIRWEFHRFIPCALCLAVQCVLIECAAPMWPVWSSLCLLAVAVMNHRPLRQALSKAI